MTSEVGVSVVIVLSPPSILEQLPGGLGAKPAPISSAGMSSGGSCLTPGVGCPGARCAGKAARSPDRVQEICVGCSG